MNQQSRVFADHAQLYQSMDAAMERLSTIWNLIGIQGDQRSSRCSVVLSYVNNLLDEMVREEESLYNRLVANADRLKADLACLLDEMGLPKYEPPDGLPLLNLEKELKLRCDALNAEKQERLNRLRLRSKVDQELCDALSMTPYYIPTGSVPNDRQLAELEEHIRTLENEQSQRTKMCSNLREKIIKLLDELELSPNTSFEREVVDESEPLSLTSDSVRALQRYHGELARLRTENVSLIGSLWIQLRALWDRIEVTKTEQDQFQSQTSGMSQRTINLLKQEINRCELLKSQTLQRQIQLARTKIVSLWDKCFVTVEERRAFIPFTEENLTEELLTEHQNEIQKMKNYYDQHKELFEKVTRRQKLWREFLDLEHKANNPDRFLNRGGNLLKEEKARKKVTAELPKIEQEIMMHISQWEHQTGKQFLIDGLHFDEYVRKQHCEYSAEKENEKILRHQQKARQMEEEILFGSKPVTPSAKRFASNTPMKTPSKHVKIAIDSPKTPGGFRPKQNLPVSPLSPAKSRSAVKELLPNEGVKATGARKLLTSHENTNIAGLVALNVPGGAKTDVEPAVDMDLSLLSLVSVGPYEEFAKGLGQPSVSRPPLPSHVAYF